MAPSAEGGEHCSGTVIKAHSIARASALQHIAENHFVYQPDCNPYLLPQNRGEIFYGKVAIRSATTFTGFCNTHDSSVFKAIDRDLENISPEQCLQLHYRAICRELYVKRAATNFAQQMRALDKGRSLDRQFFLQNVSIAYEENSQRSLQELEKEKIICDEFLSRRDFSRVRSYVIEFDSPITVACSGLTQPISDFQGKWLQNLASRNDLARLSMNLLPTNKGGICVISWLPDSHFICEQFCNSLHALADQDKSSALCQWIFDSFENHAVQISWYDELPQRTRDKIRELARHWASSDEVPSKTWLVPTRIKLSQWSVSSTSWT